MYKGNRLIAMAIGLFAFAAVAIYGCQTQDGSLPTEADRSIEISVTANEIFAMINAVITDPTLGKSTTSQFKIIVKVYPKNPADAQAKAKSLIDFILKHYQAGKWIDEGGVGTGELVAAIAEYVGLAPEADAAAACVPGVDCELFATEDNEFSGTEIPGDAITQPFVIYLIRLPDDSFPPPLFPLFFEIGTIPEGITFPTAAPSGSLTLSQFDDGPVAAVCALDADEELGVPDNAVPGSNLFLAHQENGVWEQLPYVPVTFLDCTTATALSESASLWSSPLDLVLGPVMELLSPSTLGAGGTGLGGAISSFSPHGALYTDPVPTTTEISIVEGTTTFTAGQTITLRAVVSPEPDGGNVLFFATVPVSGPGAPVVAVVDGVAERSFTCGSDRVPFGSHTAQVQYTGTENFEGSVSSTIAYECLAE
jgi:hypothetical protein